MDLKQKWLAYKDGEGEQPKIYAQTKIVSSPQGITAVMTKEIEDRDGEIVLVKGIQYDKEAGIPLLDAHNMFGSVVENVLGRATNIKRKKEDGVPALIADLVFSTTERAREARALVEDGSVDTVSIGFSVNEFDPMTNTITKSELFEVSLVSVPANPEAKISIAGKQMDAETLEKTVSHYDDIKPKIKEYRKLFMSDLPEKLGVEIKGQELIDANNVYEAVIGLIEQKGILWKELQDIKAENQQVLKKTSKVENQPVKKTQSHKTIGLAVAETLDRLGY